MSSGRYCVGCGGWGGHRLKCPRVKRSKKVEQWKADKLRQAQQGVNWITVAAATRAARKVV